MKKKMLFCMLFVVSTCLYSTIINIPGDQPTIQVGINVAVNGDTLLVQPGTYVENISYNGKNITIASLFLTTQDTTYISQTIIDGNQNGGVVEFENGETQTALLCGFTITNGSGGGIGCVYASYPRLENLIITENYAEYNGGGIICGAYASPSLENVTITNNSAGSSGGGIYCYNYCSPSLENVTISNNTSHNGGGIFCLENCSANLDNVIINNNSVNSDGGGILCAANSNLNLQNVTLTGNTAADEGGGIYINDATPSLENVTIYNNTSLYGGGIYCEDSNPTFQSIIITDNSAIAGGGGFYCHGSNPSLDDVTISDNDSDAGGGIYCEGSDPIIENTVISENTAVEIGGGVLCTDYSDPSFVNVTISDNIVSNAEGWGGGICCISNSSPSFEDVTISYNSGDVGGGILCMLDSSPHLENVIITHNSAYIGGGINCSLSSNPVLINALITFNSAIAMGGGISCYDASPSLVNVTISDNTANEGSGIYCMENSNPELIDCISWLHLPEIYFDIDGESNNISISYSNIQGGEAGIVTNNNGTVNWLEGNIDEDPLFVATGWNPLMLQDLSPCVNAGVLDTTGLNLPEFDLVGNPRIYGGRIDMGAYENQSVVGTNENLIPKVSKLYQNYPNPFNPTTTINYSLKVNSKVSLNIYNIKGQKVKTLVDETLESGNHTVIWNGKDDNNKSVSSGIYFYKMKTYNHEQTKKMILIK